MKITSKLSDSENRAYLDRISRSARDLNSTAIDTLLFVEQMVSLSALLNSFDRNFNNSFPAIDENAQDPTYFIAAYFDTKNIAEALWVYRIVRSLTRYILLSDKFYETGNDRYALRAKQAHKTVNEFLLQSSESNAQHLIYSIDYSLEQFSAFWNFEQIIRRRILENYTFPYTELRHFNLSKSSDASLVYSKVLNAKLPTFNENVGLILHYNQALLDIQDDWEDIEDDVQEDMPNIFVMAAVDYIPYDRIKKSRQDMIRKIVLTATNSSGGPVSRLVNELQASSKSVSIPENFAFLKCLSDRYADTLRGKISSSANS
ncbi:MAG TPA: hypothetical protein VKA09_00385 [Nitrososphaeraceae archaeon]|nr:hypothetical protein [Nitrososphaeraceae archaeon]